MSFPMRFTLRDMLLGVAVVAFGLFLLTPWTQQMREQARRQQCTMNLRQLGIALIQYEQKIGRMPPGITAAGPDLRSGLHTGLTMLLPYLNQDLAYNACNFRFGWSHPVNRTAITTAVDLFLCPTNRGLGTSNASGGVAAVTDYGLCKGSAAFLCESQDHLDYPQNLRGYFDVNSRVRGRDVRDGASLTIMVGEIAGGGRFQGITSDGRCLAVDQAWAKADFDDRHANATGGLGTVLAVVMQHAGPKDQIRSKESLPAKTNPTRLTISRDASLDSSCHNLNDRVNEFRSAHKGGVHLLLGDGAVRWSSHAVDSWIYACMGTICGREIIDEGSF